MLWLVGLGLGDEKDVTLRGAEVIRACEKVYLEAYTSVLGVDTAALEASYGKKVQVCDREFVEGDADVILDAATKGDAAFLVRELYFEWFTVHDPRCYLGIFSHPTCVRLRSSAIRSARPRILIYSQEQMIGVLRCALYTTRRL